MNSTLTVVKMGPAYRVAPKAGRVPIRFFANDEIFSQFDQAVFQQAIDTANAPGVDALVVGADAHSGFGCPVGSVLASRSHVYPGPVGPDIGCSMSFLQTDVPEEVLKDKPTVRALINAICERIPTGMGSRQAPKGLKTEQIVHHRLMELAARGAYPLFREKWSDSLNLPESWRGRLEDEAHGSQDPLEEEIDGMRHHLEKSKWLSKLHQLGSYGGGNHFGEAQITRVDPSKRELAEAWGLKDGCVGFMNHCGSRGWGYALSGYQFKKLERFFETWHMPFPGGSKELVYAPIDSPEGMEYLHYMQLGANFAVANHVVICWLVLEAFKEVLPGTKGELVYHIAHNIGRREIVNDHPHWVFRKGATRAFPAGHHELRGTPFEQTGHPILLPGNPIQGSRIMVALPGARQSLYSINHGAGRALGRRESKRQITQEQANAQMDQAGVLFNGRNYPVDESAGAYKDFNQVIASVEEAELATTVARLEARFVIKDGCDDAEGRA
ncbi:MAG: RtcB family protein [Opitutaceae bacterium]|nr:RtcB family protein [Opitutaceae bacterium]